MRGGQAPEGEGPDQSGPAPPPGEVRGKLDDSGCAGTSGGAAEEKLDNVGLVVWQSAFVLAEYLLRNPPFQQWADVRVVDLGTGTGAWVEGRQDCCPGNQHRCAAYYQGEVGREIAGKMHRWSPNWKQEATPVTMLVSI